MYLPAPKLDDRHFQDLVDEAKKRIPTYCEEWTDHNVSDPGVTLIELFAWMTDMTLYRVNQIPDLHYIKFMEMMGIRLLEPVSARVPITFWLSAPQENTVTIPEATEVSTTQTETEAPIIFTTNDHAYIHVPALKTIVQECPNEAEPFTELSLRRVQSEYGETFDLFSPVPNENDALYFGFDNDLSDHIIGFDFVCDRQGGAGIDPALPPYIWEVSARKADGHLGWVSCEIARDTTKGLNLPGRIHVHAPSMDKQLVNGMSHFWMRLRIRPILAEDKRIGMRPYRTTPRADQISVRSWGITIDSTHAQVIREEKVGLSDGAAGQRFSLQTHPLLKRKGGETVTTTLPGTETLIWHEVSDFSQSAPTDRHFTLDSATGDLRFGPAIRQRNGDMKLYGAIPSRGSTIEFTRYRHGGGIRGNVRAEQLNTLKTAIPFIDRVHNRRDAMGGLDQETLEQAMMRVPSMMRSRKRAVTEADFEFLARSILREKLGGVGRVKCLQPLPTEGGRVAPGQAYILIVPRVNDPEGFLSPEQLELDDEIVATLKQYLNERRLLTMRLDVRTPSYKWVTVNAQVRALSGANLAEVEAEIKARLYHFLNPITGGHDGNGWPFGRNLFLSDVYQCLQGIQRIQFIRNLDLFNALPGGNRQGKSAETIEVVGHGAIASGIHSVEFI